MGVGGAELPIVYTDQLRLERQEDVGFRLIPPGERSPIQHSTASQRPNHPIEQVLPAAIPDMASRLSVTIPPSHIPIENRLIGRRSVVVAGIHTRGVGRRLPIQRARTKLKPFLFVGEGCRCDKMASLDLVFFSLASLFAQTTLTLRYAYCRTRPTTSDTLIRI